jgi:vWA-MoxR associated protein C-terminal domain/Effector-associated domain 1
VVDWNDNEKRKALRIALQEAYPSGAALEIFVDEELNENIEVVAGGKNLQVNSHSLLKWARAKNRLDEVYSVFKRENPSHAGIKIIERQSLISQSFNLPPDDWEMLFGYFLPDDLADLQRAFRQGFKDAIGVDFRQVRPTDPPVAEVLQIRELLEEYDINDRGPILAVRFVERAIEQFQISNEVQNRDFSVLQAWRDRIAERFQVPPVAPPPEQTSTRRAYLLVTLEESGSDVIIYPELHITGAENPIGFGAKPTTCSINQVADRISDWIRQAEELLETDICDDEQVTLEVFLPCRHLEEDIAITWSVKNKRGDSIALGTHRRFVVRSSDRIRDRQIQKALQSRWTELQSSVQQNNVCKNFHLQKDCPKDKGILSALLQDTGAIGLKFLAQLPTDSSERIDLFNSIIDAAIPIALWSSEIADLDAISLKAEFDTLLKDCSLTNFTDLARQWRMQRLNSPAAKYIRILCDRPDRLPRLPDLRNREDDDAIVAY